VPVRQREGIALARLYHTVRPLRARQIAAQLRRRLEPLWEDPARFAGRAAPAWPGIRWRPRAGLLPPVCESPAERLRAGRFEFQGREAALGWPPDWEAPGLPALWRYHLHYFEFLWALEWPEARELALDWIARHPLARGRVGWDAYPISLRLLNWCGYFFGRQRERTAGDAELEAALWRSLWLQAEWLRAHLEWHLLGNHLLENGVALAYAGSCFAGASAKAWRRAGLAVLRREIPEQVLSDGGHFERSPMYLARALYALAALLDTGDDELRALAEEPAARMAGALIRLCHPDGGIALLNDSALGAQPEAGALLGWLARLAQTGPEPAGPGAFALPETGYYGSREAGGHYVVCDAAPIGPDYQPGHAHGDLFSFELSLGGRRVVVDAGVFGYEPDERRRRARSTAAHNTVEIEGQDQCEFWAAFRVARRARPRDVAFREQPGGFALAGWHDGYRRLPGAPRHARRFAWHSEGVLLVRDRLEAARSVRAVSRLHLHPACRIEAVEGALARVAHPGGIFQVRFAGPGELRVEPSRHFPRFGVELATSALAFSAQGSQLELGFCIASGAGILGYDLAAGAKLGERSYGW
jgi:uncharacterized heparinase superfamily protein